MTTIQRLLVDDVRFPTSRERHGSDAMHPDPDYSAAYVSLTTDGAHVGHGLVFTLGRGTELCTAAVRQYARWVEGESLEAIVAQPGRFARALTGDSQLRWLGPEKGLMHMAASAVINAVWDLWARTRGLPLWQLLSQLTSTQLVECIDFRYLSDVLTPDDAWQLLRQQEATRDARRRHVLADGYPAYTTSTGWLGYDEPQLRSLCRAAIADGWTALKVKVGAELSQDRRRLRIVRDEIGDDRTLMIDANQVWDVDQAIAWVRELAEFRPLWIEEPTSPDDVLGHARIAQGVAPIGVATGEMVQNRILFKQLLQSGGMQYCQLDSCRLGGINEVLAVLLLAAKYQVPVCPHGGGVGLCEQIQHLSMFDYVCVSGSQQGRWAEYVDHLHEHFVDPVAIRRGRYQAPSLAGYGTEMLPASIAEFRYPTGGAWR